MKYLAIIASFIVACVPEQTESYCIDQCLRRELFERCMKLLPAGPVSTQYNDWDDVVDSCDMTARRQSVAVCSRIQKPECRAM